MTSRLRRLLILALAATLSLQGFAASAMQCRVGGPASGHDRAMTTAIDMGMRVGMAAGAEVSSTPHRSHDAMAGAGSCAACGACCIASAPPPMLLEPVVGEATAAFAVSVVRPWPPFLTEGQDRPPKAFLA